MELSELFPHSLDKDLVKLDPLQDQMTKEQKDAYKRTVALAEEANRNRVPICISLGIMKESNGRTTYSVQIVRAGNRLETDHSQRRNRVEYELQRWKHVLLGHDEPNIMDYPDDPNHKEVPYA